MCASNNVSLLAGSGPQIALHGCGSKRTTSAPLEGKAKTTQQQPIRCDQVTCYIPVLTVFAFYTLGISTILSSDRSGPQN
jgi:hypothetical protein